MIRPTSSQIKETLFNWLNQNLDNKNCLDLFCGSGSLGLEAISRNAKSVYFIDRNDKVCKNLKKNMQIFNVKNTIVLKRDVLNFVNDCKIKFDIVFVDPPYECDIINKLLDILENILNKKARIYIESNKFETLPENYILLKKLKKGNVFSMFVELKS